MVTAARIVSVPFLSFCRVPGDLDLELEVRKREFRRTCRPTCRRGHDVINGSHSEARRDNGQGTDCCSLVQWGPARPAGAQAPPDKLTTRCKAMRDEWPARDLAGIKTSDIDQRCGPYLIGISIDRSRCPRSVAESALCSPPADTQPAYRDMGRRVPQRQTG